MTPGQANHADTAPDAPDASTASERRLSGARAGAGAGAERTSTGVGAGAGGAAARSRRASGAGGGVDAGWAGGVQGVLDAHEAALAELQGSALVGGGACRVCREGSRQTQPMCARACRRELPHRTLTPCPHLIPCPRLTPCPAGR